MKKKKIDDKNPQKKVSLKKTWVFTSFRVGAAAATASGSVQSGRGAEFASGTQVTAGGSAGGLEATDGAVGAHRGRGGGVRSLGAHGRSNGAGVAGVARRARQAGRFAGGPCRDGKKDDDGV